LQNTQGFYELFISVNP